MFVKLFQNLAFCIKLKHVKQARKPQYFQKNSLNLIICTYLSLETKQAFRINYFLHKFAIVNKTIVNRACTIRMAKIVKTSKLFRIPIIIQKYLHYHQNEPVPPFLLSTKTIWQEDYKSFSKSYRYMNSIVCNKYTKTVPVAFEWYFEIVKSKELHFQIGCKSVNNFVLNICEYSPSGRFSGSRWRFFV